MSIFGWSYPPGCNGTPYDEEHPIQLHDDKTIKGYGRRQHGLNGKDADLDSTGQNVVESAWWFDGYIEITGYCYASVVPSEDWDDDQNQCAYELVCGCGYPGEWDGDYWVLNDRYQMKVDCDWTDDETAEQNIARACRVALDAISKHSANFEKEMAYLNEQFEHISAEYRAENE